MLYFMCYILYNIYYFKNAIDLQQKKTTFDIKIKTEQPVLDRHSSRVVDLRHSMDLGFRQMGWAVATKIRHPTTTGGYFLNAPTSNNMQKIHLSKDTIFRKILTAAIMSACHRRMTSAFGHWFQLSVILTRSKKHWLARKQQTYTHS